MSFFLLSILPNRLSPFLFTPCRFLSHQIMAPHNDHPSPRFSAIHDSEIDTPETCRARRRRRIQMRRLKCRPILRRTRRPSSATQTKPPKENPFRAFRKKQTPVKEAVVLLPPSSSSVITRPVPVAPPIGNTMPVYGSVSVQGLAECMDDMWLAEEDFCRRALMAGGHKPLHFFAVYDGHGGPYVSTLCKNTMHVVVAEELMRSGGLEWFWGPKDSKGKQVVVEEENPVKAALEKSFERVDEMAMSMGKWHANVSFCGSTAVVAIVTPNHIVVANCGDSRAVLCRAGEAIALSRDHKPTWPDEQERIHRAGGKLIYRDGLRVFGILNLSRALGDKFLKKFVTSQPEITITEREPEDECLILASDGLWDVISNGLACNIAQACLRDESLFNAPGFPGNLVNNDGSRMEFASKSAFAATILCRLALARGSRDNITVVVVDLKTAEKMPN